MYGKTQEKMINQSMALTKISIYLDLGRYVFKSKTDILSCNPPGHAIRFCCMANAKGQDATNKKPKTFTDKLAVTQNKCLGTVVTGAFQAIPSPVLDAKMFIAPMDVHLDHLQAKSETQPPCRRSKAKKKLFILRTACKTK